MNLIVSRHAARGWEKGLCAMSHHPAGGHPQGWDHKLADRSSLPPASGEERIKAQSKHVFTQPQMPKAAGAGGWREETEGSSGSSARTPSSGDPPAAASAAPYLRWARTLHDLLEDAEGVRLFRKFVASAGGLHLDRLNFYFAVHGLRHETEPPKIRQVVSAIYKFLRKSQLTMPEELRTRVKQSLKDGSAIERTIFDAMEHEVTRTIMDTTYQAFLRSEAYVTYVSAATQPLSSPSPDSSPPSSGKEALPTGTNERMVIAAPRELPTLHEGQELAAGAPARLTRNLLMATQGRRALQPELATDGLSVRGAGVREAPRGRRSRPHGMDRNAVINADPDTAMVIPRTLRVQTEQLRVLPPAEFAPLLIEKLERVRRDQDSKDKLDRKLMEGDGEEMIPPQMVAAAIREKLQVDDDNDQDILDQHVSRVWSERTPGGSPPGGRRPRPRRRAPSTLSADSGHCDAPPEPAPARRAPPRRPPTELTDSGVSVVSEVTSGPPLEPRVLMWIQEGSERHGRRSYLSSRASSAERRRESDLMPPLGVPHVPTQLDEARRRLQADTPRHQRTRASAGGKTSGGAAAVGSAAAAPAVATSGSSASSEGACTVVVVSFLDESVPYRIKVPAAPLTLKLFKDYLPRKGNYRYFFKTECAELDNTVIQEEVVSDGELLPTFEGKVMARVKSVE